MTNSDNKKPWGGRFSESTDALMEQFNASVGFDRRLYRVDIQGSVAHARMLARVGILSEDECAQIIQGLEQILADIERGDFAWSTALEDVHMNIEARLTDRIGDVGKKLHTGRSRNDQVATDVRLYLREHVDQVRQQLLALQQVLLELAEQEADTIMPGYTHLQPAQPVTFGHHMMAWFEMLQRDRWRLADCRQRLNVMPLGSAALAGTSFPIDRAYTAELLGFDGLCANSLDAVSDRDFIIEFLSGASLCMMHLSRFSEELVLWSSGTMDYVDLGERFCTGSSIMPQKKNPDVPELIRGKCGRVYGNLVALLTLMKAQPLAYNKDNQEDKEPLFDTLDTLEQVLEVFTAMMQAITVKRDNMLAQATAGFTTATDLADYLVRKGIPFRDAHEVVGKTVRYCLDNDKALEQCSLQELQQFSATIEQDVSDVLTLQGSVAARNHPGGTAPEQVRAAIKSARQQLEQDT
jgi:argininosuccinate lyase